MRRVILLIMCLVVITTAFGNNNQNMNQSSLVNKAVPVPAGFKDGDLTKLVEDYTILPDCTKGFQPLAEGRGFPLELVNLLGKAVYENDTSPAIRTLDDKSLRLTREEYSDLKEKLPGRSPREDMIYYGCDLDGDGEDEIFEIPAEILYYPGSFSMFMKSGESYDFNWIPIGPVRSYGIFQMEGIYYLAADCNAGPLEAYVMLYRLDKENFSQNQEFEHICILRRQEISGSKLLYKNNTYPLIEDIQIYIDEIMMDLIDVGTGYGTFYGDETERPDLSGDWQEDELEIFSIDVNNDGKDEYFERNSEWYFNDGVGQGGEMVFQWFDDSFQSVSSPLTLWKNAAYVRKQTWFKKLDGKTVSFSLYYKEESKNQYMLDARIQENGRTTILMDYAFAYTSADIELMRAEYDINGIGYLPLEDCYYDPDIKKAYPDNLEELADSFIQSTQDNFSVKTGENNSKSSALVEFIKNSVSHGGGLISSVNFYNNYSGRMGKEDFIKEYHDIVGDYESGWSEDEIEYVYFYHAGPDTYFLAASGIPGITSLRYNIYKKTDGELSFYCGYNYDESIEASFIRCEDEFYRLDIPDYDQQTYFWRVVIDKLAPDIVKDYAAVRASANGYRWNRFYGSNDRYEKAVTEYLNSIKTTLMSQVYDSLYTGDETKDFDPDKLQRLKSYYWEEGLEFYEIDFNNDGTPEYVSKTGEHGDYLIFDTFRFEPKKLVSIPYDFRKEGNYLCQLWFKKLDGKVFTFKLTDKDGYFHLNVSLTEEWNITQVYSCIITPEMDYEISFR